MNESTKSNSAIQLLEWRVLRTVVDKWPSHLQSRQRGPERRHQVFHPRYTSYEVGNTSFSTQIASQIAGVRSLGGDVMVSFGGAAGQELAQVINNVSTLTNAYEKVINTYNLTNIDFDIEGAAEADTASIDLRSQAIAQLEQQAAAQGKTLNVGFTLPVLPSGLTSDGLYALQSALKYGVKITGVNIMTMDYGDGAAPNRGARWAPTPSTPLKASSPSCEHFTVPARPTLSSGKWSA